ncbi:MAG: hypothetical protein JWN85_4468, partial [Gammaproteobacteria bacterium]|nr:hypothetical protein [Gammaproteobacteria bacterium]
KARDRAAAVALRTKARDRAADILRTTALHNLRGVAPNAI